MIEKNYKYFCLIVITLSFLICFLSFFNYYLSENVVKYVFYAIYISVFSLCYAYEFRYPNIKVMHIRGILSILMIFIVKDHIILAVNFIYLIFAIKHMKKNRWPYILFSCIFLIVFCMSLLFNCVTSKSTEICNISANGSRILIRDVYDVGGWGYRLNYYVIEKHGFFERKYLIAMRGQMNSSIENKFIDENTLDIQNIIYTIKDNDVSFTQPETNLKIIRKKRMTFFGL